jgi:hypothetical protein
MSSSFFKGFYILILSIILFSIIIIILFIPALASDSNFSFTYNKTTNISSTISSQESIQMSENSGFIWPTPRLYYSFFKIWKKSFSNCRCFFLSLWHRYCSSCTELILFLFYLAELF